MSRYSLPQARTATEFRNYLDTVDRAIIASVASAWGTHPKRTPRQQIMDYVNNAGSKHPCDKARRREEIIIRINNRTA